MSEFEEVFDHPDNKGQYLTKQELEEYNKDYIEQSKIVVKFECRELGGKV